MHVDRCSGYVCVWFGQETMDAVVPVVKRFQAEIDSLSKRCKMAEAAFLTAYQRLANLPGKSTS